VKLRTATTIAKTMRTAWGVLSMSSTLLVLRLPFDVSRVPIVTEMRRRLAIGDVKEPNFPEDLFHALW
jgi:hypothetical protein